MTETPTPAQDLAAIDRVVDLALAVDLITEEFADRLDRVRAPIALELDRRRALRDALVAEWRWDGRDETVTDKATERVLAAFASVGARIVWPSPDSAETPERPAGARTAPGIDTASTVHRVCRKTPGCVAVDGHDFDCAFIVNKGTPTRTAREKILAAVAAVSRRTPTSDLSQRDFVELAIELLDVKGGPSYENLVIAASFLVDAAAERMDADR